MPEGLVGEPHYTISGPMGEVPSAKLILANREVCAECNSDLSILDQCLQDELGFFRVLWNNSGTKRGRSVTTLRPGLYAARRGDKVELALNADASATRASDGTFVPASSGQRNAVAVTERVQDGVRVFRISQPVHITKRFIRALHKIAFELVAYQYGFAAVLDSAHHSLRRYIRFGEGQRTVGIEGRVSEAQALSLPCQPRLALRRDPLSGWWARIQLGRTFLVHVGPRRVRHWGAHVTVTPTNPRTILRLAFDVTVSN